MVSRSIYGNVNARAMTEELETCMDLMSFVQTRLLVTLQCFLNSRAYGNRAPALGPTIISRCQTICLHCICERRLSIAYLYVHIKSTNRLTGSLDTRRLTPDPSLPLDQSSMRR